MEIEAKKRSLQLLTIRQGLSEKQIVQLIAYAQSDPLVQQNTSDAKRFRDVEAFEKWKKKGRAIYAISDEQQNLLGIIWLGQEPLPERTFFLPINPNDYETTLAMRTYGEGRGKGLAKPFLTEVFRRYVLEEGGRTTGGIWIETSYDNVPVTKTFFGLGFVQVTFSDERRKIIMVGSKKDILPHVIPLGV